MHVQYVLYRSNHPIEKALFRLSIGLIDCLIVTGSLFHSIHPFNPILYSRKLQWKYTMHIIIHIIQAMSSNPF